MAPVRHAPIATVAYPEDAMIRVKTNNKLILSMFFSLCAVIIMPVTCSSTQQKSEEKSFADDCRHCHGERLQGVRNIKATCGQCHMRTPLAPEDIQSATMKDILFQEPHIHTTKNIFSSTPSCYFCHRKTDF